MRKEFGFYEEVKEDERLQWQLVHKFNTVNN